MAARKRESGAQIEKVCRDDEKALEAAVATGAEPNWARFPREQAFAVFEGATAPRAIRGLTSSRETSPSWNKPYDAATATWYAENQKR